MLNVYSRTRDGETLLSRSFRAKEFACKDGTDPLFVDSELVQVLQAIRDHFGAPVVITSGYRTAAHNRAVGGAVYSQHQYGRAADIRVSGVPVEQLAAYAETLLPVTASAATPQKALSMWMCAKQKAGGPGKGGEWNGNDLIRCHCRGRDPDRRADRQQPQSGRDRHQARRADPRGARA